MKNTAKLFVVVMLVSSVTFGATILHYDFEDSTAGMPMNDFPVTQENGTVGTADLSGNDYHMHAWDDYWGPLFSSEGGTPSGTGLRSLHGTFTTTTGDTSVVLSKTTHGLDYIVDSKLTLIRARSSAG